MNAHDPVAPWRAAFDSFKADNPAAAMGAKAREAAFARFAAHGMPTKRDEYWKYTPVRDLDPDTALQAGAEADIIAEIDAFRIVFVDGVLDAARSDREALAALVEIAGPEGAPWMDDVFNVLQARPVPGAMFQVERPFACLLYTSPSPRDA